MKTKMKVMRRLTAWLLTAFLVLGELGGNVSFAYAAEDETTAEQEEAVPEEEGAEAEENEETALSSQADEDEDTALSSRAERSEVDADLVREADKVPPRRGVAEQQEGSSSEEEDEAEAEESEEVCEEAEEAAEEAFEEETVEAEESEEEPAADTTEEEDAAEDEAEAEAVGAVPTELYMTVAGEDINLLENSSGNNGKGSYYYNKKNGILLIYNLAIEDSTKHTKSFGIRCNGDLKLLVLGKCSIKLKGNMLSEIYGINVNGKLTIMNADTDSLKDLFPQTEIGKKLLEKVEDDIALGGSLLISAGGTEVGGSAIRCTGDLVLKNAEVDIISGVGKETEIKQGKGFSLECIGTTYTGTGDVMSSAIDAGGSITIDGADVKATGGDNKVIAVAVNAGGDISIPSGTLEVTGGLTTDDTPDDLSIRSVAVMAEGDISIGTYANVTVSAKGSETCEAIAVYSSGNMTIKGDVSAKAESGRRNTALAVIKDNAITLDGTLIETPAKATIAVDSKDTNRRKAVLKEDGSAAGEVKIVKGQWYDLWVYGERVNNINKNDILGDGKLTFTPETGVLYFDDVTCGTDVYTPKKQIAVSGNVSLKLRGKAEFALPPNGGMVRLYKGHDLDLQGEFTVTATSGKVGSETASCNEVIHLQGEGATLTIDGEDTKLTISGEFNDNKAAVRSAGDIIIKNGTIDISGANRGIDSDGFKSGDETSKIDIQGGHISISVSDPEKEYTRAIEIDNRDGAALLMAAGMVIKKPAGGADISVSTENEYQWTFVGKEDGKDVKELEIISGYKPLAIVQADGEYGTELADYVSPEEGDEVVYEGTTVNGEKYGPTADKPSQPGEYTITVTRTNGTDHYRASVDFVISRKYVTATVKAVDREYNGDTHVELSDKAEDKTISGIVAGDTVTLDVSAGGEMGDANAGIDKKVAVTGVTLAGDDAYKYLLLEQPTGVTVTISPAEFPEDLKTINYTVKEDTILDVHTVSLADYIEDGTTSVEVLDTKEQLDGKPILDPITKLLTFELKKGVKPADVDAKILVDVKNATNYENYALMVVLVADHVHDASTLEKKEKVSASCETPGVEEHYECRECGAKFVYKDDTYVPVTDEELEIAAPGHSWTGWKVKEKPTAEKDGKKVRSCTVCDAEEEEVIPAGTPGFSTHSALDPVPEDLDSAEVLWLVQGQKFTIGTGWALVDKKKEGRFVSISGKGVLKAKKVTEAPVSVKNGDRVIKINISKPAMEKKSVKLEAGKTETLKFNYDIENLEVYWYSPNPDVATVEQNGEVTAVAKGKAKITAYVNGSAYTCTVSVTEDSKNPVKLRTLHLNKGGKKSVSVRGVTEWISPDKNIATTAKKKITGEGAGEIQLTGGEGGEYKIDLTVEDIGINAVNEYAVKMTAARGANKYNLEIIKGREYEIGFIDVEQPMTFKSSKPDIAFADENGLITARAVGKSKITTKINGKTVTINVVVTEEKK
ncbi:MAG: Ig-like domain-containing protein [Lachnospiraceae bacterium]|nr:Ig-like domain-containing protein [Lachnospiraceae bacterium]